GFVAVGRGTTPDGDAFAFNVVGTRIAVGPGVIAGNQAITGTAQAASLGTLAILSTVVQNQNIGTRLGELRRGGTGVSASGLTFAIKGQQVALGSIGSMFDAGGAASADTSGIGSKLGLFVNGRGSFGDQTKSGEEVGFDFH